MDTSSARVEPQGPLLPTTTFHAQTKKGPVEVTVSTDYEVEKLIGSGSYGVVVKVRSVADDRHLALKQIVLPSFLEPEGSKHLSDYEIVACRTVREIRILRFLQRIIEEAKVEVPYFIHLHDILQMSALGTGRVSLVMQLLQSDLHAVLRNPAQELSEDHVQFMMYDLLRAVFFLHSAGIAHRDIKPQNILVNENCDAVLCDFGLAREISESEMTVYVETRWWRAPELIMGLTVYDEKVDIWSLGCVMAEMLMDSRARCPLWRGANAKDQLDKILFTLGVPSEKSMQSLTSSAAFAYLSKMRSHAMVPKSSQLATKLLPGTSPHAVDLVNKMLSVLPKDRISAGECLQHPFFSDIRDEQTEHRASQAYDDQELDFIYDRKVKSADKVQKLNELLYAEMAAFHPELEKK